MATKRKNYKKSSGRKPFWESLIEWVLGFCKKLVLPALFVWLVAWLWMGGVFAKAGDIVWSGFVDWTANQGLVVKDVVVTGRNRIDPSALREAMKVKQNDPVLLVDVDAISEAISTMGWVEKVVVRRGYDGIVTVDLTERIPFVIWDRPGRGQVVVDTGGTVISSAKVSDFKSLLVVRGVDAPQNAADLMRMIVAEPTVADYIKGAEWIGGRRWDLMTVHGTRIHLPDDDMGFALSRLAKAVAEQDILEKPLKSLDLRAPDRIIIENNSGVSQLDRDQNKNKKQI